MKKIILISLLILFGCEGEQGPVGPQGEQGADGTWDGTDLEQRVTDLEEQLNQQQIAIEGLVENAINTGFLETQVFYGNPVHSQDGQTQTTEINLVDIIGGDGALIVLKVQKNSDDFQFSFMDNNDGTNTDWIYFQTDAEDNWVEDYIYYWLITTDGVIYLHTLCGSGQGCSSHTMNIDLSYFLN